MRLAAMAALRPKAMRAVPGGFHVLKLLVHGRAENGH